MRVVILNGFPINILDFTKNDTWTVTFKKASLKDFMYDAKKYDAKCYIRHPATAQIVEKYTDVKCEGGIYRFNGDDIIYVVALKKPVRGEEVSDISEDDLFIVRVIVAEGSWM